MTIKYSDQSGAIYRRPELFEMFVNGVYKLHPGLSFKEWLQMAVDEGYLKLIGIGK